MPSAMVLEDDEYERKWRGLSRGPQHRRRCPTNKKQPGPTGGRNNDTSSRLRGTEHSAHPRACPLPSHSCSPHIHYFIMATVAPSRPAAVPASVAKGTPAPADINAQYSKFKNDLQALAQKIGELEGDVDEHAWVALAVPGACR